MAAIAIFCFFLTDIVEVVGPAPAPASTWPFFLKLYLPLAALQIAKSNLTTFALYRISFGLASVLKGALSLPALTLALWLLPGREAPPRGVLYSTALASVGGVLFGIPMDHAGLAPDVLAVVARLVSIAAGAGTTATLAYLVTRCGVHPLYVLRSLATATVVVLAACIVLTGEQWRGDGGDGSGGGRSLLSFVDALGISVPLVAYTAFNGGSMFLLLFLYQAWGAMTVAMARSGKSAVFILMGAALYKEIATGGMIVGSVLVLAACVVYARARSGGPATGLKQ